MQNTRHTGNMISRAGPPSFWLGTLWIGASGLLVVAVGWLVAARILFSPLLNKGWTSYPLPGSNQDTQVTGLVVDRQDRIWVVRPQRRPSMEQAAFPARDLRGDGPAGPGMGRLVCL